MAGLPFPNYSISKHLSQINKWWALKPAKQNTISFYFLKLPEGPPDPLLLHRASKCNSSYIRAQKLPSNRSTVTTSQQFIHVKPRASTLCQISLLDERWSIAQWLAVARLAKEAIFGVTTDLNHKSTALFVHWVHVVFPPCAYIWALCTGCALFIQSKPEAFCTETRVYYLFGHMWFPICQILLWVNEKIYSAIRIRDQLVGCKLFSLAITFPTWA